MIRIRRVPLCLVGLITAMVLGLLSARASASVHVARAGETLDSLSEDYYGSTRFSMVIRAANGFMHPDDGRLLEGERVEIPEVIYHTAVQGETWEDLAHEHLGSTRRGVFLAEMNGVKEDEALVPGMVVKIPYQLLYVLAPNESLKSVTKTYLGGKYGARWLKSYSLSKKKKWKRGAALLVPLLDVEFTPEQKAKLKDPKGEGGDDGPTEEDRLAQKEAVESIASMREAFARGRYIEIISTGQRLLGTGKLTEPQMVGVYQFLAFAYVAFGQRERAIVLFRSALSIQPEMELSPITTSPKILNTFREAQRSAGDTPGSSK